MKKALWEAAGQAARPDGRGGGRAGGGVISRCTFPTLSMIGDGSWPSRHLTRLLLAGFDF